MKRTFENPVFGDKATILKSASETNGACTLLEVEVAAGGGNSPHVHHSFTEKFHILHGELDVHIQNRRRLLRQGDVAEVPIRTSHFFTNRTTNPVRFLVELRPAQPGFEKAIAIAYGLALDGKVNKKGIPKKFTHVCILTVMSGTTPSGIFKVFMPLFRLIAKRSRNKEAALVNRYCR